MNVHTHRVKIFNHSPISNRHHRHRHRIQLYLDGKVKTLRKGENERNDKILLFQLKMKNKTKNSTENFGIFFCSLVIGEGGWPK